jgi:hypothetical protein
MTNDQGWSDRGRRNVHRVTISDFPAAAGVGGA